jgi:protease I
MRAARGICDRSRPARDLVPSLRTDLRNAGAERVDQEVVSDRAVVTSRKPDDSPVFNREMIELFSQAHQVAQHAAV